MLHEHNTEGTKDINTIQYHIVLLYLYCSIENILCFIETKIGPLGYAAYADSLRELAYAAYADVF